VTTTPGAASGTDTGDSDPSPLLLVLGALGIFVALASLFLVVVPFDRSPGTGRRRLGMTDAAARATSPRGVGERLSGAVDQALERGGRRRGLAAALDVAGISLRPGEFVVLTVSFGIAASVLLYALFGPIGLLLGLVLTPIVARLVVSSRIDRRRAAFAEQLPDVLQLLISSLRAGYAVPQGLDAVASQAAEPARSEFERVMFESRIGRDLGEALGAAAERMASRDFDWVVAAFNINREIGGDLATVLENVAGTIRERQQLRRQIKTLTAEGRISAYVLTALPLLLAGVIALINPDYFEPLTQSPGPQLIAAAVVLMVIGWIWMRRLIKAQL
jgi:tight adherence protein B